MPAYSTGNFWLYDPTDQTKVIKFDASNVSTGKTRVLSAIDSNGVADSVYGRATVDFITGFDQATVTVSDTTVTASSRILAKMADVAPPDGRDIDETQAEVFEVKAGNIIVGVSFDIVVNCVNGPTHGQFSVDYVRS